MITRVAAVAILLPTLASPAVAEEEPEGRWPVNAVIQGVEGPVLENVEALLSLQAAEDSNRELDKYLARRLHERARDQIARALEPFGYYRPQIDGSLRFAGKAWVARYRIEPGPTIPVARVQIELIGDGAGDPELRKSVEQFPLREGQALHHGRYEEGKRALLDQCLDRGYFRAEYVTHAIRLDLEAYRADVVLELETGPRLKFGDVVFEQDVLIPELLAAYVPFEKGEPYNREDVDEMRRRLVSTPYFTTVRIRPRPEDASDGMVPIVVTLTPQPKRKWTLGAGFGTDTGPRGRGDLEVRRFGHRGHRARIGTRLSDVRISLEGAYEIPWVGTTPRVLAFTGGLFDDDLEDGKTQTVNAGVVWSRFSGSWRRSIGLSFDIDDFEIGVDSGQSKLLAPHISFSRTRADDRLVPRLGYRFSVELRGAWKDLGSNASYVQGRVEGKGVVPLGERWRALGRFEVGYTETSDFHDLPPRVRFFAGGDTSVRGFDYQDLGRVDSEGAVIGGEALLVGSLELERRLWDKWGVAVFVDSGNAMRTLEGPLATGAGFGARWRSPIGMIRADLAWAISEPDTPIRFHLTIGPDL